MSGILAVMGSVQAEPSITSRNISVASATEDTYIDFQFLNTGELVIRTTVQDVVTIVDSGQEWAGGIIPSTYAARYQIRLTISSGNVPINLEFEDNNVWYSLSSSPFFSTDFTAGGVARNGVWRFQIREASSARVVTTADYTLDIN